MFYEGSNASASDYRVVYARGSQMVVLPQTIQQETEYKLQ
ncbi:hypothetical protein ECDEC6E_1783 [Escherichia coli DEC6E]|nr:hypothetical protein ECDEC6E_1783 [Escherichia coli DEC6E]